MSKRLQVLIPEEEFERVSALAARHNVTVSELVRECLKKASSASKSDLSSSEKLTRILNYSKLNGPTGDIEQLLAEIDAGKELK
jgi:Ribbon-helix-helix protein, copG family